MDAERDVVSPAATEADKKLRRLRRFILKRDQNWRVERGGPNSFDRTLENSPLSLLAVRFASSLSVDPPDCLDLDLAFSIGSERCGRFHQSRIWIHNDIDVLVEQVTVNDLQSMRMPQ